MLLGSYTGQYDTVGHHPCGAIWLGSVVSGAMRRDQAVSPSLGRSDELPVGRLISTGHVDDAGGVLGVVVGAGC